MIEVRDLVKRYGSHTVLDHLSFTVNDGQIYGFLGPNGAGKSTTMNILTGYIGMTEGSVTVSGHDLLEEPDAVCTDDFRYVKGGRVRVIRGALRGVEGEIAEMPDGAFLAVRVNSLLCALVRIPMGDAVPID